MLHTHTLIHLYVYSHFTPPTKSGREQQQKKNEPANGREVGEKTMKMLKLPETHFESMFYNKSTSTYNNNDLPKWQTVHCSTRYFTHTNTLLFSSIFTIILRPTSQHQQQQNVGWLLAWFTLCVCVTLLGSFQLVCFHPPHQSLDSHISSFTSIFSFKFYCTQMTTTQSFSCF